MESFDKLFLAATRGDADGLHSQSTAIATRFRSIEPFLKPDASKAVQNLIDGFGASCLEVYNKARSSGATAANKAYEPAQDDATAGVYSRFIAQIRDVLFPALFSDAA